MYCKWADKDLRDRIAKGLNATLATPQAKKQRREQMQEVWKDPQAKQARVKEMKAGWRRRYSKGSGDFAQHVLTAASSRMTASTRRRASVLHTGRFWRGEPHQCYRPRPSRTVDHMRTHKDIRVSGYPLLPLGPRRRPGLDCFETYNTVTIQT